MRKKASSGCVRPSSEDLLRLITSSALLPTVGLTGKWTLEVALTNTGKCLFFVVGFLTMPLPLPNRVVPVDDAEAYQLFEKAADQGHVAGMFMAADCLLNGVCRVFVAFKIFC